MPTIPTVHLNGTPAARLRAQTCVATAALRGAWNALVDAEPHMRDYYPQGPDAYTAASDEHASRLARIQSVLFEIQALALAIDAQRR